MGQRLDTALAVLNGTVGDYLERTQNGLAMGMSLTDRGQLLPMERRALSAAYPDATGRVVVMAHGLMTTESIWRMGDGTDYGSRLRDDVGYTPLYLRYNTGLPIADNGAALSTLLDGLVVQYPVPITELILLGYSLGGLVLRSACHVASVKGHAWLGLVRRALYVGTPHRGAPGERLGRVVQRVLDVIPDPTVKLVADIARMRSAAIQDLGDSDLTHEDRARRVASLKLRDPEHPVPLLPTMEHYLIAGTYSEHPMMAEWFGDMAVPLSSGTNRHSERVRVYPGMTHMELPRSALVYAQIKAWCEAMQSPNEGDR